MLKETYAKIRPSIVAIARTKQTNEHFFTIIGTGFFIREDGLVLTNQHVLEQINNLPEVKSGETTPFKAAHVLFFHKTETSMQVLPLRINNFGIVEHKLPADAKFYGEKPDLGLIVLEDVRACPTAKIFQGEYFDGELIASSGFPMGTDTLKMPGWIHQLAPTLKTGVISAVLPFECKKPHALLLNIMSQGGASGSPVFLPESGEVIGIIYGGIMRQFESLNFETDLSYCVPSWYINELLENAEKKDWINELRDKKIPILEWIASRQVHEQKPRGPLSHSL